MTTPRTIRRLAVVLATVLATGLLGACGSAAAPAQAPTPAPTPTAVPGPGGVGGGTFGGGAAPPPAGIIDPGGGLDPILGRATFVFPSAGLTNEHPVNVQLVRATVNARDVTAELRWWSGVAPCTALDSVKVENDAADWSIKLRVIEGSGRGHVACIDIAQLKATFVELGVLAAGTWTISADGDAPPITLEVA